MEEINVGEADLSETDDDGNVDLVDCKNCGRHFAPERIEVHEMICQKQKKRKPFDVIQQRVKGTEAEKFLRKCKNPKPKPEKANYNTPQKSWRKQHEELMNSMKAAREVSAVLKKGGNLRDLPMPPPLDYSDYIQCPHCARKFNSSAAQRHIPKCAEMQHNKPKAPAKTKTVPSKTTSTKSSSRTRK